MNFENVIYNCDCVKGMRSQIPDNSIDLIVTSPPYNVGIKYDSYDDNLPIDEYFKWSKEWISECFRTLKPDGRICINHYVSCGTSEVRFAPLMKLNDIAEEIGFHHHGCAIWEDTHLTKRTAWGSWLSASAPYLNSPYEGIVILYKDHWKKDKEGVSDISPKEFMEIASGVWKMRPCMQYETIANFPPELPRKCIRFLSYIGDIVMDPFSGAGTTCLEAKLSNRKYVGFEISPNYWKTSIDALKQTSLFSIKESQTEISCGDSE